jgi:hypothetical protein
MLYNTDICLAVKNEQGRYIIRKFTVFELDNIFSSIPSFKLKTRKQKEIVFSVKCSLCGENHEYNFRTNEFLKRDMLAGGCETTGMPLFFIGKYERVNAHTQKHNEICSKFYAITGAK